MLSTFNRLTIALWIALVPGLAATGTFGTYTYYTFGDRLLFWGAVVISSSVFGYVSTQVAQDFVPDDRPPLQDAVAVALMVATFTPILMLLISLVYGATSAGYFETWQGQAFGRSSAADAAVTRGRHRPRFTALCARPHFVELVSEDVVSFPRPQRCNAKWPSRCTVRGSLATSTATIRRPR